MTLSKALLCRRSSWVKEKFEIPSTSFRFSLCDGLCRRKVCVSTPLAFHFANSGGQIAPVIQWHLHGCDLFHGTGEVLEAGDRGGGFRLIEQGYVFPRAAHQDCALDVVERHA